MPPMRGQVRWLLVPVYNFLLLLCPVIQMKKCQKKAGFCLFVCMMKLMKHEECMDEVR